MRDYAHVSDLARAHVAALDYMTAAPEPLIANLGTGAGYSVRQVVDTCRRITGRDIVSRDAPRRAGDPPELVAAVERARERQSDQQQDRKIELQEQRLAGNRQVESCEMADIDRQRNCGGHGHD